LIRIQGQAAIKGHEFADVSGVAELVQAAKEAAPVAGEAMAAMDGPQLSAFERVARQAKDALRAAGGEGLLFGAGVAWLAQKLASRSLAAPTASRELTAFERVAQETKRALRENGGEPYTGDGQSFWQRSIAVVAAARDRAASWIKETAQDFVGRFSQNRNSDHDEPGLER